jgi:hypothetical protein
MPENSEILQHTAISYFTTFPIGNNISLEYLCLNVKLLLLLELFMLQQFRLKNKSSGERNGAKGEQAGEFLNRCHLFTRTHKNHLNFTQTHKIIEMGTLNILLHHFSFSYSLIAHHYQS